MPAPSAEPIWQCQYKVKALPGSHRSSDDGELTSETADISEGIYACQPEKVAGLEDKPGKIFAWRATIEKEGEDVAHLRISPGKDNKGQAALRLISRCKGKETQFIQVLVNKFQCKEAAMKAMITLGEAARSGANKEKLNEMRVQLYRDGAAVPEAVPAAAAVTEAAATAAQVRDATPTGAAVAEAAPAAVAGPKDMPVVPSVVVGARTIYRGVAVSVCKGPKFSASIKKSMCPKLAKDTKMERSFKLDSVEQQEKAWKQIIYFIDAAFRGPGEFV